jgi:hypothetical protein
MGRSKVWSLVGTRSVGREAPGDLDRPARDQYGCPTGVMARYLLPNARREGSLRVE